MKTIFVNKDNYVASPYIHDARISIEVSDELYEKVSTVPFYKAWKMVGNDAVLEYLKDDESLRALREQECFSLIDNRSRLWYNSLTEEQNIELQSWYEAWLHVTDTKEIPNKLEWL